MIIVTAGEAANIRQSAARVDDTVPGTVRYVLACRDLNKEEAEC